MSCPVATGSISSDPFQHPGGGVFGAGRAAAMRMCDDLGIDFDKIGVEQ